MKRKFFVVGLGVLLVAVAAGIYFGVFYRQATPPELPAAQQPTGAPEEAVVEPKAEVPEQAVVEEPGVEESATVPTARVESVIDGDTFVLATGERVRLIGVNTPEKGRECYLEAKERLKSLVERKEVRLESGSEDRDQYGRLLRYVYVEGAFVNEVLVREGFGYAYFVGQNAKHKNELINAERLAKQEGGCLWAASSECPRCIELVVFHYDAEGNDCDNLNDEYVTFKNACDYSCVMTGWTVKDEASRPPYTFPEFELNPNATVTLYTGFGDNTASKLYWGSTGYSCNAIWNNKGDTLFLRDGEGGLVLEHGY